MSARLNKIDKEFVLKLYKDGNAIAFKTQIHFSLYNVTYFQYRIALIRKYYFDFSCPYNEETKMIELNFINIL